MGGDLYAGSIVIIITIFFNGWIEKISSLEIPNSELEQLTEELFSSENSSLQNHVKINLQGRLSRRVNRDIAPQPLITVDPLTLETPVIQSLRELFDNYELNTLKEEYVTTEEYEEEENFIKLLLNTKPVNRVMNFLSYQGFIEPGNRTYKQILRNVWFTQYARQRTSDILGSSGFEHTFIGEMKSDKKFMGLHNWISFNAAEASGKLNYWGYKYSKTLGNETSSRGLIYATYSYSGKLKSSSFFVGISPELDISLSTLCYFVRPNKACRLSLGGTKVKLQTYILDHEKRGIEPSLGSSFLIV